MSTQTFTSARSTLRDPERGAQSSANIQPPPHTNLKPFSLKQSAAEDYDPEGTGGEHHDEVKQAIDGDKGTSWSTENYEGGTLNGKSGVGIYVIADPPVAARAMQILTPTKGWDGAVYVAPAGSAPSSISGWKKLGDITSAKGSTRVDLDTAHNRFRYYLVWITKLPPGKGQVEISEIRLFR